MTTALLSFFSKLFNPVWLTGPLLDKELRVSSRRRRNYVLRFAYVLLLTIFVVIVWLSVVKFQGTAAYQKSRMAVADKTIITTIVTFQFIATQLIAVIMLSTSISDEVYNRTLGLLMTTPINSFQIVMGKLFSKLLQLILLLAISLPLLAIVRIFGGVPWDYIISSFCITLTAVIFVGSLSLFFSIFSRRAYVVIIVTILTLGVLFALLPFSAGMLWNAITGDWPGRALTAAIFYHNPFGVLFFKTEMMMSPRMGGGMPFFSWPLHCGIMLAASAVVLSASVINVRKVALRQATGQSDSSFRKRRSYTNAAVGASNQQDFAAVPRRVKGPSVLWKELRFPMFGRHKAATFIGNFVCLSLLFTTYWLCAEKHLLDDEETHILYAVIFLGLGILVTVVLASTCITSEKESRSWPLLLATTLDDRDILFGKFVGTLWRCFPIWLFLFGHTIIFSLAGFVHPIAIIQIGILVAWVVVFLSGTGLYFSSCYKHTTTAVIMNFALAAVIWGILPLLMVIVVGITREGRDFLEVYMNTNPFVHTTVIMEASVNKPGSYRWLSFGRQAVLDGVESTAWMLVCMVGYMLLGFLFAWRAEFRFRQNIF